MNFKTWKRFCDTKPIHNELDAKLVFWISGSALLVTRFRNLFLPCFDYNFLHLQEILIWLKNHLIVYNLFILNSWVSSTIEVQEFPKSTCKIIEPQYKQYIYVQSFRPEIQCTFFWTSVLLYCKTYQRTKGENLRVDMK